MNILDIILLLCFIPAIIEGIRKGFIAQVIAIISLVLGGWLSFRFATLAGTWMEQWVHASPKILTIIAFILIFMVVVGVLYAIGKILEKTIKIILLGWLNRLLGVIFSLLKCVLIIGLLIILFETLNNTFHLVPTEYLAQSVLYGPLLEITTTVFPYLQSLFTKS